MAWLARVRRALKRVRALAVWTQTERFNRALLTAHLDG